MQKTIEDIKWRLPWRPLIHAVEITGLQRQLERQLTDGHALWGAKVIARRVDSDDVLVLASNGALATVHLDWASRPHKTPSEYPSIILHASLAAFQQAMDSNAHDYGDEQAEAVTGQ